MNTHANIAPRLTIAIPAYNRADFLPTLLISIAEQLVSLRPPFDARSVEVCISDNASVDATKAIVEKFSGRIPRLVYHRNNHNIGPDRNYLKAVEISSGDFCWLMGSDDRVEEGALQAVLDATVRWHDTAGFSVNMAGYDIGFLQRRDILDPFTFKSDKTFCGSHEVFANFGAYYGYLSGQVIRRDLWIDAISSGEHLKYLNAYVHVFVIGRMIQAVPKWAFLHQRCVGWRSGNDSFLSGGWYQRMAIDVIGYHDVTVGLFGKKSKTTRVMRDNIARVHAYLSFRGGKQHGQSAANIYMGAKLLTAYYWKSPVFWRKLFPLIVAPGPLCRAIYLSYVRIVRPTLRAHAERKMASER